MALNCDLFSKREGTRKYILLDNSSAEYSEPLWLTPEQVKMMEYFAGDSGWQLVDEKDRLLPRSYVLQFYEGALHFYEENKDLM